MATERRTPIASEISKIAYEIDYNDLGQSVIDISKKFILDVIGCILGARDIQSSKVMTRTVLALGGEPESTVMGYDKKTNAPLAALINGTAGHAFDMDDDHREGTLHSSVVLLPSVLSIAEKIGATGKELITAFALGSEHMIRLGESFLGKSYYQGFHPTGTTGVFGAALGVGKIMKMSPQELVCSLGIAGSQAAGLLEWKEDGTWTKRLQAGHPAMCGVLSALLAKQGYTGPATIFEGNDGFERAYSYHDQYDVNKIADGFGSQWELLINSIKPHACCRFACPIADAALQVARNNLIPISDIETINVRCNDWMIKVLGNPPDRKYRPQTVVDAQFSMPYVVAVSMVHKRASVPEFTDDMIFDKDVLDVANKVTWELDEEFEKLYPKVYPAAIKVTTKNGITYEAQIDYPKGDPENPLTEEELVGKFKLLASATLPDEKIEKIISTISSLEEVADVSELTKLLTA